MIESIIQYISLLLVLCVLYQAKIIIVKYFKLKNRKWRYDKFYLYSRWKQRKYSRNCDWTILGISWWWTGPFEKRFTIHLFGLELRIWFIKDLKEM